MGLSVLSECVECCLLAYLVESRTENVTAKNGKSAQASYFVLLLLCTLLLHRTIALRRTPRRPVRVVDWMMSAIEK